MAETENISQKSDAVIVSESNDETSGIETNSVSADETETSTSGASVVEDESGSKSKERAIRNAFIAGFLFVAILLAGCSVFTKQNEKEKNVAEVADMDMYDVYAQMPEKSRLLFLESFFENKTETASYVIDSQREAVAKIIEMAEIDPEQAQRLAIMFSGRAHILTQIWDLAPQYVLALDQVLIDKIKKRMLVLRQRLLVLTLSMTQAVLQLQEITDMFLLLLAGNI